MSTRCSFMKGSNTMSGLPMMPMRGRGFGWDFSTALPSAASLEMTGPHGTQTYSGVAPQARSTIRGTASVRQVSQTCGSSTRAMPGSSRSMRMTRAAIALAVKHTSFTQLRRAHSRSSASRGRLVMLSRNEADEPVSLERKDRDFSTSPPSAAPLEMTKGTDSGASLEITEGAAPAVSLEMTEGAASFASAVPRMAMAAASVRRRMRMCARSLMSSTLSVVHGLPTASSTSAASSTDTASNPQPNDCRNTASSCG